MIWVILFVILMILEVCTYALVSIWFALGTLVALTLYKFGYGTSIQIVGFSISSLLFFLATKPFINKFLVFNKEKTNVYDLIDREGIVIEDICNDTFKGVVKVYGKEWTARSTNGENIDKNSKIKVDKIEGVKMYVSQINKRE